MLEAAAHRAYWRFGRHGAPQAGRTNRLRRRERTGFRRPARRRAIHRGPAAL